MRLSLFKLAALLTLVSVPVLCDAAYNATVAIQGKDLSGFATESFCSLTTTTASTSTELLTSETTSPSSTPTPTSTSTLTTEGSSSISSTTTTTRSSSTTTPPTSSSTVRSSPSIASSSSQSSSSSIFSSFLSTVEPTFSPWAPFSTVYTSIPTASTTTETNMEIEPEIVSTTMAPTSSTVQTSKPVSAPVTSTLLPPTPKVITETILASDKTTSSTETGTEETLTTTKVFTTTTLEDLVTSSERRTILEMSTTTTVAKGGPIATSVPIVTFGPSEEPTLWTSTAGHEQATTAAPSSDFPTPSSGTSTGSSSSAGRLPFSSSESSSASTSTESATTTSPYLNFSRSAPYVQGCEQKCPEGSLEGVDNCYSLVADPYNDKYSRAQAACEDSKTGHLMTKTELMRDQQILRPWLENWNLTSRHLYVGQRPLLVLDGVMTGIWTTMADVTYGRVSVETFKIQMVKTGAQGICSLPQNCGNFRCSFDLLYERLRGQLELPLPEPLLTNETFTVRCSPPSDTTFTFRCSIAGVLSPSQALKTCALPKTFNREVSTPWNQPTRKSCGDCFEDGTETCSEQNSGFSCECRQGWRKNRCWKSPAVCYSRIGSTPVCLNKGTCIPLADTHLCECMENFAWADCSLFKDNVSWTGSDSTAPFFTTAKVMTIVSTAVSWAMLFFKICCKFVPYLSSPKSPDIQTDVSYTRTILQSVAGIWIILWSQPGFLRLNAWDCRSGFFLINWLTSWIMYLFLVEAANVFFVSVGVSRNRYEKGVERVSNPFRYRKAQKSLLFNRIVLNLAVPMFLMCYLFGVTFSGWDSMTTNFSCLGPLAKYDALYQAHIHFMFFMVTAASLLGLGAMAAFRYRPERYAENLAYAEMRFGPVRMDRIQRIHRLQYIQPFQGLVKLGVFLVQVLAQDLAKYSKDQSSLDMICYVLIAMDVFLSLFSMVALEPKWIDTLMVKLLPRLPSWTHRFFPTLSPYRFLNHREIIARHEKTDLEENAGFLTSPADPLYISLERRHQFCRHLTRSYIGMRLRGSKQERAVELIELAVASNFSIWMEENEMEQWEAELLKWQKEILAADTWEFKLPRTRPDDRTVYLDRLRAAWVFSPARIVQENLYWNRLHLLRHVMGCLPLEPPHSSWTLSPTGRIGKNYLWEPQVRHWSQFPALEARMKIYEETAREQTYNVASIWSLLAPELYLDKADEQLNLRRFPGAERYLKLVHLDDLFYQSAKLAMIASEDLLMEQFKEAKPHLLLRIAYALVNWTPMKPISLRRLPLPSEEQFAEMRTVKKLTVHIINGQDEDEFVESFTLDVVELGNNRIIRRNRENKNRRKKIPPLSAPDLVGGGFREVDGCLAR